MFHSFYVPIAVKSFRTFVMLICFLAINQSLRKPVVCATIHIQTYGSEE